MIYKNKTDLMKSIIRLVGGGYYYQFTQGEVPIKKAQALTLKFSDRYQTNLTAQQRYRRKKKKQANSFLLMCPDHERPIFHWFLLVTEGEGLVHQMESLQDVRAKKSHQRLHLTGYELVKTPRKGKNAKPLWTWRMSNENFEAWQERLRSVIRGKRDEGLRQAWYSLRRVPGFSECRKQAYQLARYAQDEWRRTI